MAALEVHLVADGRNITRVLGWPVVLVKVLSSSLLVLGGAIIGREGPTVQPGASIFDLIGQRWKTEHHRHTMLVAGAAAGLAAAFNTPLGGIVFAIEELSRSHFAKIGHRFSRFSAVPQ